MSKKWKKWTPSKVGLTATELFQFNKLSHNCCGWSVFGVVGEKDVQMEVTDEDDEEELDYENNLEDWKKYINKNKNKGYNKQTIGMFIARGIIQKSTLYIFSRYEWWEKAKSWKYGDN